MNKLQKERERTDFIAELFAYRLYSLASRINAEYLNAVAHRRPVRIFGLNLRSNFMNIFFKQRLSLLCRGRMIALLVQKLLCSPYQPRHSTAVVSQRHFVGLKNSAATCVSTLQGHSGRVTSVAFHPSAPYLATSSWNWENTTKLWLLNADCSDVKCVSTLQGHTGGVISIAFHPSAPYIVTGSFDNTARVWLLNADCSAAKCVSMLQGHKGSVFSVAFHSSEPYLATGSTDGTAKLWLLNADYSAATCVSTMQGHGGSVYSVAFHPSAPYLVTGSYDDTAKLWR